MKELTYFGMTVTDGVRFVKSHFSSTDLQGKFSFSELHNLGDANMTLPFKDNCGEPEWIEFANAVIQATDRDLQQNAKI